MPWHTFNDSAIGCDVWRLIVLAILVLLVKRIPIVLMVWKWIPDIKTFREALFTGYFGPMGVGAIFMCTYARLLLPEEVPYPPVTTNDSLTLAIQPIVFFFVLASVIVHGLTVPFFAFGKHAHVNLSRTLTTYNTTATGNDEPGWLSSVRRLQENERAELPQAEEQNEVLDARITSTVSHMEKDADLEKGLDGPQSSHVAHDAAATDTNEIMGADNEDEDSHNDEEGEWGGETTIEMKKLREKRQQEQEGATEPLVRGETDISDAPSHNGKYPKLNHWLEGRNLVLEYTKGPLEEPVVELIRLTPEEHALFYQDESPIRSWIDSHTHMMESLIGIDTERFGNSDLRSMWTNGIMRKLKRGGAPEKGAAIDEQKYENHIQDAEIMYAGHMGHGLEHARRKSSATQEANLMSRVSRNLKPFTDTTRSGSQSHEGDVPRHDSNAGSRRVSFVGRLGSVVRLGGAQRQEQPSPSYPAFDQRQFDLQNRQEPPAEGTVDPFSV